MDHKSNQLSLPWTVDILSHEKWVPIAFLATQDLARDEARYYTRYTTRYHRVDEPTIYYP